MVKIPKVIILTLLVMCLIISGCIKSLPDEIRISHFYDACPEQNKDYNETGIFHLCNDSSFGWIKVNSTLEIPPSYHLKERECTYPDFNEISSLFNKGCVQYVQLWED